MTSLKKLALGTVQWGINYGIANHSGMVTPNVVTDILAEASTLGIEVLDTAAAYGKSEEVLGLNNLESFKVVTKTPIFNQSEISDADVKHLNLAFKNSLISLRCKKVYGLLVHDVKNLLAPGGEALIQSMLELKEAGFIEKIGVSVYDSHDLDAVLKKFSMDLVQVPLNILDQRMLLSGHLDMLKDNGIEIHSRSVFLQGLLLLPINKVPKFFDPISPTLNTWHEICRERGLSAAEACLAFVKNVAQIDRVLVGIDGLSHLRSNANDFMRNVDFDAKGLSCASEIFINPSLWRVK